MPKTKGSAGSERSRKGSRRAVFSDWEAPRITGVLVLADGTVIEGQGFRTLQDGESVEYEAQEGPKGSKALKVRRLSADVAAS